ncbi:MAG: DNA internalization-related competence protein ComEC/Rec2 [Desulfobacula sp. RIFOXYB2_FULL_45_6]|nr:MAG: DNA internalization-related competence protein ComEC/Rec2 [Desulfobacula sp. RIFOXYB2_FULL_45_6]
MKIKLTPLQPPSLFIFLSLMTGILSGNFFPDSKTIVFFLLFFSAGLLILSYCFYKNILFLPILLLIFWFGYFSIQMKLYPAVSDDHISHFVDIKKISIKGKIVSFTRHYEKKIKVTLQCQKIVTPDHITKNVRGDIDLSIYLSSGEIPQYGDFIEFESTLHSFRNFQNPGAFDYVRYSMLNGLSGTSYCDQKKIRILKDTDKKSIFTLCIRAIEKKRIEFYTLILDRTNHSESGKTLASLVTGKTELIPPDFRELFSKAGISHLFAISGLHLSIVGFLFFTVIFYFLTFFQKCLITGKSKKMAGIITILPLTLYCIFSGFSPSTQRAYIMTIVLLISFVSEKEKDVVSSISVAGILILMIDSSALFSISFQLSFIAVFFIIYGLSLIKKDLLAYKNNLLGKSALLLCVTFFASLGTSPLTAYYFNIVSFVQLISNFFFIPVIGCVVLPLGIISLITFPLFASFSGGIIDLCHFLISLSIMASEAFVSIPFSWLRVMSIDLSEIILIYLILASLYAGLNGKKKFTAALAVLIGIFSIYHFLNTQPTKKSDQILAISIIDVGQGNSALIQTPQGSNILVDGGGMGELSAFDTGKYILAPFLWNKRVDTLDYVILSHPESDHLNGLIYILKNFNVHTLIKNQDSMHTATYRSLVETCQKKGIHIFQPSKNGEPIPLGEAKLLFFSSGNNSISDNFNNNSLVFKISYKNFSMLFPGDILKDREKNLIITNGLDLHSDILLAPHHGSSSSSTQIFLDQVQAGSVIISCGHNNRYKFPHPDVLKRYIDMGIQVFRTDRDGAVFISSDGREHHISTHKGG